MDHFEKLLAEATAKGANGVSGVVVAVVDKEGNYVYKKTAGNKSLAEDAPPMDFDSTYAIASCTKLITSIAALQCVERGQITLDEPLDKLLPELAELPIIEAKANSAGTPPYTLKPAKKSITLRHLLTHTSGTSYEIMNPSLIAWRADRGEEPKMMIGKVVEGFSTPRTFEAGESWSYGTALDWAGLLVGRLNNSTFGEYVEQHIFGPLSMNSTTFHLEQKPHVRERLMAMSTRGSDGKLLPGPVRILADPAPEEIGGAGLYSSVPDYTRVLADLLKESPVVLKKETVDMMFTPQLAEGSGAHSALTEKEREIYSLMVGGMSSRGVKLNFGLGSLVVLDDIETPNYYKPKGTLTWSGLPNLVWAVNREKGLALFYATQIVPWGDEKSHTLTHAFETAAWKNLSKLA
ncbi:beta-lactamase/transpeptidase-like protein [Glonium stellatum]|uniref:Beta-lactamase/transpeptidase-like protein n=1 Tax=Glonium stellatum TaxID=574774 RepID=A0A8E2JQA0_9PEZI|nr:beta-lactamase/transpeptidase-like protein [Glonium stellatum]